MKSATENPDPPVYKNEGVELHVLGLDPGRKTGVALYVNGVLSELATIGPVELQSFLVGRSKLGRLQVVFEDSRLISAIYSDKDAKNEAAKKKIARDVGGIDMLCLLIEDSCKRLRVRYLGLSPKEKGAKVAASAFEHITGWEGRTNEHERDAAMVARPFRKGFAA